MGATTLVLVRILYVWPLGPLKFSTIASPLCVMLLNVGGGSAAPITAIVPLEVKAAVFQVRPFGNGGRLKVVNPPS